MASVFSVLHLLLIVGLSLAEDVIVGTGLNFEEVVKANDFVVAEFYAPWCGHCKTLEPEYAKAAKDLASNDPPITLMKIDATDEANKELAAKYGVQGFPTLKIFRDGDVERPTEYSGPRDSAGIVSYLKKKLEPPSLILGSAAQGKAFLKKDLAIVGLFKEKSKDLEVFLNVAKKLSDDYSFAHTTNPKNLEGSWKVPTIRLYKTEEDKQLDYSGEVTDTELEDWVSTNALPVLLELDDPIVRPREVVFPFSLRFSAVFLGSGATDGSVCWNPKHKNAISKAFNSPNNKFYTFIGKEDKNRNDFVRELTKLAESLIGEIFFINIAPANDHALKFFGLEESETPAFVFQTTKDKFILRNVDAAKASSFYHDIKAGKIERSIKSEAAPADNKGPVTVVTGRTFDEIAFSGKNVLLEFYAPWCGHCKKLEPTYEKVGKNFAKDKDVVIAKIDATANDIPSDKFQVSGFPTIAFVTKSGEVLPYSGDRSEKDLVEFVKKSRAGSDNASTDHQEL